ncbi:MAG: DUF3781 domain-containing protein [Solobacterium sp.]|jgi:hypothetical protein|nr:DUF3781 domain-containing protein [Solobacterium sp.]MCH4222416.1 DUF3781 domain-containing protein [Solobacterium sp.]MCH4265689.1 DUF3781 domain-containing protein [Solobacterium sp.]
MQKQKAREELIAASALLHSTPGGYQRCMEHLHLNNESEVLQACIKAINDPKSLIIRAGKNYYVEDTEYRFTINASSKSIITAYCTVR